MNQPKGCREELAPNRFKSEHVKAKRDIRFDIHSTATRRILAFLSISPSKCQYLNVLIFRIIFFYFRFKR